MAMRTRLGLLYGGRSAEHEVSIVSARAIFGAVDRSRYEVSLIRIGRDGFWTLAGEPGIQHWPADGAAGRRVILLPHGSGRAALLSTEDARGEVLAELDVVFPVLHGPNGEDGTVQGLLQASGIAYVGAGVLGSAVGMDKDVMKRLLRQAGLPTAPALVLHKGEVAADVYGKCVEMLGCPLFLKPANTGSSVGISKVENRRDFERALALAFSYDHKVVVEAFIDGREIECAILGTRSPRISVPGEIVTTHEFYSYQAKYLDEAATSLLIPADIPHEVTARMNDLARRAYQALCCAGMARMDFFLDSADGLWINEINTIPGFTRHSMFPLLWAHSGVSFGELVDLLVSDAQDRHRQTAALRHSR